jgi:ribosome maturation factor RimP
MCTTECIESIVEEKLASLGYELYELKLIKAGSRSILRLFIDKEGGITVDDCEKASNEISVLLDVENFSQRPYTLEVSSPGIDRPLTTEKDFKRAIGNTIRLRLKESDGKSTTLHGNLIGCSNGNLTIETQKGIKTISISNIHGGKIEITFK